MRNRNDLDSMEGTNAFGAGLGVWDPYYEKSIATIVQEGPTGHTEKYANIHPGEYSGRTVNGVRRLVPESYDFRQQPGKGHNGPTGSFE